MSDRGETRGVLQHRHHLVGEKPDRAQRLLKAEIPERELPDEIVRARFLELRPYVPGDAFGVAGKRPPVLGDRFEFSRPRMPVADSHERRKKREALVPALVGAARASPAFFPTTMNRPSPILGKGASPHVSLQTARNRSKQGLSSATVSRPTTFMPRRATRSAASGECTPYHSGGCGFCRGGMASGRRRFPLSAVTVTAPSLKPSRMKPTISWCTFSVCAGSTSKKRTSAGSAPRPKAISSRPPLIWSSMQISSSSLKRW